VIATGLSPARRVQTPITVVHSATLQRTGTDNLPVLNQAVHAGGGSPLSDYTSLNTPSVWRNPRTAAAKVDALASNGMDEIEIPAFLRKQAD
jgi:cell division protein FtsZ